MRGDQKIHQKELAFFNSLFRISSKALCFGKVFSDHLGVNVNVHKIYSSETFHDEFFTLWVILN